MNAFIESCISLFWILGVLVLQFKNGRLRTGFSEPLVPRSFSASCFIGNTEKPVGSFRFVNLDATDYYFNLNGGSSDQSTASFIEFIADFF